MRFIKLDKLQFLTVAGLALITTNVSALTLDQFSRVASQNSMSSSVLDVTTKKIVVRSSVDGTIPEALEEMRSILLERLVSSKAGGGSRDQAKATEYLSNGFNFLNHLTNSGMDFEKKGGFVTYLSSTQSRLSLINEAIKDDDSTVEVFSILEKLYNSETGKDREKYFKLMLAVSIVWDQPRQDVHQQIGDSKLSYQPEIVERYKFYKKIYSTGKALMPYRSLDYSDLIYVVDTPVPVFELEWTLKNEKGTLRNWGDKYSKILYDTKRLTSGEYTWPTSYGPYTLRAIKKLGGICVDQAYFCVITARAYGIPALYFSGQGRRGGHAWFSYMDKPGSWKLDVGRYSQDKYATGNTTNPQNNQKLTDHDVKKIYNRVFSKPGYKRGYTYSTYAELLFDSGYDKKALAYASLATRMASLNDRCWDVYMKCAKQVGGDGYVLKVLDKKISAMKKYPDGVIEASHQKIAIYKEHGKTREAANLLAKMQRGVGGGDRDDLELELIVEQVKTMMARKRYDSARRTLESTIKKNKDEGARLLNMIGLYLTVTKEAKQTRQAVKFVIPFVKSISKEFDPARQTKALSLMHTAYVNNGDHKKAGKLYDVGKSHGRK